MIERKMNRDFDQDIIRYPDPAVEVLDLSFRPYVLGTSHSTVSIRTPRECLTRPARTHE